MPPPQYWRTDDHANFSINTCGDQICQLCPGTSDLSLFRYREGVVDLDAEISDRALDLGVTEQELDRPQVAGAPACRYYRFFFFAKIAFQLSL